MAKTRLQEEVTKVSKHKRLVPLKYSGEEVWERMGNGLCIFCEEKDSPEHQLKHKRLCIVAIECDDQPLERSLNDEELVNDEVATEPSETKHGIVKPEANANMILANLEEKSASQFQVPVSDLEHGLRFHNASAIVCEDSQYVVGCDELCDHQKSILQVSYVKEVEELPQKSTSGNGEHVAHQLFDQKPVRVTHKEKHMKHLKAWKFKFKPTSKRSRLKDDRFSFVDATILLNKDPQETIWDCVKKEFKETMAGCGKTRVDRLKLIHATPRPGVYDKPLQSSVWDRGRSLLECVDGETFGVDKFKEWLFKVEEFFSIDFTPRELKVKLALNHFDGDAANWHQSQVQTGHLFTDWGAYKVLLKERFENVFEDSIAELKQLQEAKEVENEIEPVTDKEMLVMPHIAINANLGFSEYNIKDESMKVMIPGNHMRMLRQLHKSRVQCKMKMQKMDLFSFGTHAEMEGNVKLKQLLAAMERFSQEVIEQNIEGQLQDVRKGEAESFPCLNFAANQPLLWMQNTCEPILIVSELERMKKKLGYKTWMFKYKAPLRRVQFLHYYDKEVPIATNCAVQRIWDKDSPEVDITGAYSVLYNVFEMVKELLLKTSLVNPQVMRNTKLKFSKRWMFKYKDVKESIQRLQILLRYKNRSELKGYVSADRESEGNQPTLRLSAWVREILLNHYMVRLLTLVAYAIHFLGGVGKDKKQSHLSLWINRVWDPGRSLVKDASYSTRMFSSLPTTIHVSLLCQESLANQITSFSPNLEVKVSLKGEDVIQDKRREKSGTCEFARESS